MMRFILFLSVLFIHTCVFAQPKTVQGVVTAFNKFPLNGVEVTSKLTKQQVLTDEFGQFVIAAEDKDVITLKAQGFENLQIRVKHPMKLQMLNMVYINSKKNEAVAVGYGYIKKEDLTYGVNQLSVENNDYGMYQNIYELIVQKVPGVTLINEGGSTQFMIRGPKTFHGSSAALLVVDGAVVNDLSFLSVTDVATVSVLKDSEASIYGSRGANGVILIYTKRGKVPQAQ